MSEPKCRLATVDDLPQLVELRILMQKEVNPVKAAHIPPTYPEEVSQYFLRELRSGNYVSAVAEIDGRLVSANGLIIYHRPPSINGGTGRVGYLCNVYTLPEWRGHGIASALMRLIVSYGKGARLDKLHLGATDDGIGVYQRVGFEAPQFLQMEMKL